jgi:hypothetical protein
MAVITSFERTQGTNLKRHGTDVVGRVFVFGGGPNGPIFQINTYGSPDRQNPDQVSQTVQLERSAAHALWTMLGEEYGFK